MAVCHKEVLLAVPPTSRHDRALEQLVRRANQNRAGFTHRHTRLQTLSRLTFASFARALVQRTPARLWLHLVVVALVPLALVLSQNSALLLKPHAGEAALPAPADEALGQPMPLALGPIALENEL